MSDPICERIAQNVVDALQKITVANGYSAPLASITRAGFSREQPDPQDLATEIWQYSVESATDVKAPYGQRELADVIEVCVYIRDDSNSDAIRDRRLNLARSDIEKALMADPRRGGLCYIDNIFYQQPDRVAYSDTGIYSISIYLYCCYRVMRDDPARLAPVARNQFSFQGGAVLLMARYVNQRQLGAFRQFENLRIAPLHEPTTDTMKDDREGAWRNQQEITVGYDDKYEINGEDISPQMLAWLMGGGDVELVNQSETALAGISHLVYETDSVIPLHDSAGTSLFEIVSIESVTDQSAANTYELGSDYLAEPEMLRRGIIAIPSGSTIPAGSAVLISFTPGELSARPAFDVSVNCDIRVKARIEWSASDGSLLVHDFFDASFVAQSETREEDKRATTQFYLTILGNGSSTPAGRFIIPAGPIPADKAY